MLKAIKGTEPKTKPDKVILWLNALVSAGKQSNVKKVIMASVKYLLLTAKEKNRADLKDAQTRYAFGDCVVSLIGELTPREFIQMFPPDKVFNGQKYNCKDYYSTMKFVRTLPQNKPIGNAQAAFNFLWDYMNNEIHDFLVEYMVAITDTMHLQGKPGPGDKIIEELGIDPYYEQTDEATGQRYLLNGNTGKTVPIKKRIPRYLKAVK